MVAAQGPVRDALEVLVRGGRAPRALLLSGPEGVGKAALAEWFAARLWCAEPEAPCGACPVCRKLETHNHPDLHRLSRSESSEDPELVGGKEISVGAVRALAEALARRPAEAPGRVALVFGAEDLNEEAQNALLKLLEEPPGASRLVLVAHREAALLPTVRSRCQDLVVPPLDEAALAAACPELEPLALQLGAGRPGRARRLAQLSLEPLLGRVDAAVVSGLPAAELAGVLAAAAEELDDLEERDAVALVLEVVAARLVDLAWVAAGRPGGSRLIPAPEALPDASGLRALGLAVGEAQRDLARNLPAKVALLALGREFATAGLGARGASTP